MTKRADFPDGLNTADRYSNVPIGTGVIRQNNTAIGTSVTGVPAPMTVSRGRWSGKWPIILGLGGVLFIGQALFPPGLKPADIILGPVNEWRYEYAQVSLAVQREAAAIDVWKAEENARIQVATEESLLRQREVAARYSKAHADRAGWYGVCGLVGAFLVGVDEPCRGVVDSYYGPAVRDLNRF